MDKIDASRIAPVPPFPPANLAQNNQSPAPGGATAAVTYAQGNARTQPAGPALRLIGSSDTEQPTERLRALLGELADSLPQNAKLSIRLDKDANRFVYEFLDPKTGEVTAQFPTEQVLKLLKAHNQPVSGAAVDRQA